MAGTHGVEGGLVVLEAVGLVYHEVRPVDAAQVLPVLQHQLVRGDHHLELVRAPRRVALELEVADYLRPGYKSKSHEDIG